MIIADDDVWLLNSSSPFESFFSIILRLTCVLNFTVMSVGTTTLELFILHDLCCEVFSWFVSIDDLFIFSIYLLFWFTVQVWLRCNIKRVSCFWIVISRVQYSNLVTSVGWKENHLCLYPRIHAPMLYRDSTISQLGSSFYITSDRLSFVAQ